MEGDQEAGHTRAGSEQAEVSFRATQHVQASHRQVRVQAGGRGSLQRAHQVLRRLFRRSSPLQADGKLLGITSIELYDQPVLRDQELRRPNQDHTQQGPRESASDRVQRRKGDEVDRSVPDYPRGG